MRRIIALILILALSLMVITSCKKDKGNENDNSGNAGGDNTKEPEVVLPGVDYLNDDLSEYIEIAEQYYKGYKVTVDPDRIPVWKVENPIIQALCKHKSQDKIEGDGVISVGDVAHIYYKGYYLKDGAPYYFEGGSNMGGSTPHALEIGSGGFIPGFEYNLIGKNPADYTDDNPIVVEAFFPEDYQATELAGITAYFIVKVESLDEYDAPELDDAFVVENLKMTEESLADYDGETLTEKYRSYLYEKIALEEGLDVDTLTVSAFCNSVMEGAVVKKYPEKQLKDAEDAIIEELEYYYYQYYHYYYEYDDFMCLYLGLNVGSDWKTLVTTYAKNTVKQELIFYHIMNLEGLKPSEEEYQTLFDAYMLEALEANGITPDKYNSTVEYENAKANYKKTVLEQYGDNYFRSMIYYREVIKIVKTYAVIEETEENVK